MPIDWWISLVSGVLGIGLPIGAGVAWLVRRARRRRELARHAALLETAASDGEVALCVSLGGRGEPETDVRRYLERRAPGIARIVVCEVPAGQDLVDPGTAQRVLEDLIDWVRQWGRVPVTRIHLFYGGMNAYPYSLGALLGNVCPVVVYQFQSDRPDRYVRLYEWGPALAHRPYRLTEPLCRWSVATAGDGPGLAAAAAAEAPAAGTGVEEGHPA